MIEIDVKQGSKEWVTIRRGKVTGIRLKDVLKSDNLALVDELISEIDAENFDEVFSSKEMDRGKEYEPVAKAIYCEIHDTFIQEVGFCMSEEYDYIGLSPDGFTPDRTGAIEIKCPSTKTHVKYIRQGIIPAEYKPQVLMYFIVNKKLEWLDFISYDDRFKSRPYFEKRVTRQELETEIHAAEQALQKFWQKLLKYYQQVTK